MTLSRSAHKASLSQWAGKLKSLYRNNPASCCWLLEMMRRRSTLWTWEMLLCCPDRAVREIVGSLVSQAISEVAPLERARYGEVRSTASIGDQGKNSEPTARPGEGFVVRLLHYMLLFFPQTTKHWERDDGSLSHELPAHQYFHILANFFALGTSERGFGLQQNLLCRTLDLYLGNKLPATQEKAAARLQFSKGSDLTNVLQVIQLLTQHALSRPELMPEEAMQMLTSAAFLGSFLLEGPARKRYTAVRIVVQDLCRHSLERSQAVLGAVMEGFQVGSYHQYRPYFRVLSHLLKLADEHQSARVDLILATLLKVMERQQHYWKETDFCMAHLLRLAHAFPLVRAWLYAHGTELDFLLAWVDTYPRPPNNNKQAGLKLHKRNQPHQYHQKYQTWTRTATHGPAGISLGEKKAQIKAIQSDAAFTDGAASDSDDDLEDRLLATGTELDVQDTDMRWLEAKVLQVHGRSVYITYVRYSIEWDEWIEMSSPRIAAAGTFCEPVQEKEAQTHRGSWTMHNDVR